jgi:hypothetical protein
VKQILRIKVCLDCGISCPIDSSNYVSLVTESVFNNTHRGHRIQIMGYDDFVNWKQKTKGIVW